MGGARWGRPASTSVHALADVAQRLFLDKGFEQVSVDDIASAAGISRRTFFRYFPAKADVLWVESPAELERLREALQTSSTGNGEDYKEVLIRAVLAALQFPPERREWALHRAQLVFDIPAVQAHTAVRQDAWRTAITEFVARRTGHPVDTLFPVAVGHATAAGVQAALRYWVAHPDEEPAEVLRRTLELVVPAAPPTEETRTGRTRQPEAP